MSSKGKRKRGMEATNPSIPPGNSIQHTETGPKRLPGAPIPKGSSTERLYPAMVVMKTRGRATVSSSLNRTTTRKLLPAAKIVRKTKKRRLSSSPKAVPAPTYEDGPESEEDF